MTKPTSDGYITCTILKEISGVSWKVTAWNPWRFLGTEGTRKKIIIALDLRQRAFLAAVRYFRAWLRRDRTRQLEITWSTDDGPQKRMFFRVTRSAGPSTSPDPAHPTLNAHPKPIQEDARRRPASPTLSHTRPTHHHDHCGPTNPGQPPIHTSYLGPGRGWQPSCPTPADCAALTLGHVIGY